MKNSIAVMALLLAASGIASAGDGHGPWDHDKNFRWHDHGSGSLTTVPAPEIDPASAIAGLTMLAGGLAVLRGRRRK